MRHAYLIKSLYVFLLNVTHIKKPHPACRVKFAQLLKVRLNLTDIILMNQQLKKSARLLSGRGQKQLHGYYVTRIFP